MQQYTGEICDWILAKPHIRLHTWEEMDLSSSGAQFGAFSVGIWPFLAIISTTDELLPFSASLRQKNQRLAKQGWSIRYELGALFASDVFLSLVAVVFQTVLPFLTRTVKESHADWFSTEWSMAQTTFLLLVNLLLTQVFLSPVYISWSVPGFCARKLTFTVVEGSFAALMFIKT